MPIPKPTDGESHDDFIDRCMSDDVMVSEYDDKDQRLAVCQTQWDDKESKAATPKTEMRVLPADDVELRIVQEDGKLTKLSGYAAKFNKDSENLGFFIERIRPGAFTNALKTSDVRALVNHDPNLLLGRTESKTLRLVENKRGLKFEVDLPDTQAARDVAESITRGDMTGSSFSFQVVKEEWTEHKDGSMTRELIEVDPLFDVSAVTYPAYPDTSVAVRSLDHWKAEKRTEEPEPEGKPEPESKPADEAEAEPSPEPETETPAEEPQVSAERQMRADKTKRAIQRNALDKELK